MGKLVIIATPIGNLEDITLRAVRMLGEVDAIACEDTRMTRKIFQRYEIDSPGIIFSYHEHNEERAGKRILGLLEDERTVALTSDGGYPGISDPGYRIINSALSAGHELEVLPGASAPPVALLLSGLSTSSYTFKGFPPRKSGPRQRFLLAEAELPHTMIVFESPHRLAALLKDAHSALGDRLAAVCIELTKRYERVERGTLAELAERFEDAKPKGEVTVVIAGKQRKSALRKAKPKPPGMPEF